jgi:trk system potassium uptake protein TrkH
MNIAHMFDSVWMALRQAAFHVSSIMTTTGYTIGNFDLWPSYSKFLLVFLMLIGASAGSTGGGIKCIRAVILLKAAWGELIKIIHPSAVSTVKADGRTLDKTMVSSVALFFFLYLSVLIAAVALVSLDNLGIETTLTAVTATLGNIGPGLSLVGPAGNYAVFSPFSKIVLSFCMLVGRLEIYPMLLIFLPATWKSQ